MCCPQAEIAVLLPDSPQSEAVLRTARQLAMSRCPVATIVLLRVIPPPVPVRGGDGIPLVDLAERQADRELRALAQELWPVPVRRAVLVGSRPDREIGLWLTEHRVEAIVVGGAERRRWRLRSAGTLLTALVEQSRVPVVVAPACANDGVCAALDSAAALAEANRILHSGQSRV